jgi:TonB family protein
VAKLERTEAPPEQAKQPPEPPKPKPVEELKGQIVETARPERMERPEQARYLGRYDMKVEREQRSTGRKRQGRELGKRAIADPSELQSPTSERTEPTTLAGQPQRRRRPAQAQAQRAAKAAKPAKAPPAAVARPTPTPQAAPPTEGPGAAPGGPISSPVLRHAAAQPGGAQLLLPATSPGNVAHNLQALAGSPGSDDYLPDVDDEGETNLLNTRKFRYWDFFQRVRERVRGEWNPSTVWRERDPSGKRFGVRDRLTVVRVTLDADGGVKQLRVQKPSGLGFLDDEAQRAFAAAGPYPNPPAGLLNARGEVEFQFGFMFEISAARFRFYRMDR